MLPSLGESVLAWQAGAWVLPRLHSPSVLGKGPLALHGLGRPKLFVLL